MWRPWGWMVWTRLIHILSLLRRTDSLQLARASMPCKIMSEIEWLGRLKCWPTGVSSLCGSVTIETFLKWVLSLTDILNTAYSARYQINYVTNSTGNVALDLVVGTSGVTLEGVRLQDMFLAGNTEVHLNIPCWMGEMKLSLVGGTSARTRRFLRLGGHLNGIICSSIRECTTRQNCQEHSQKHHACNLPISSLWLPKIYKDSTSRDANIQNWKRVIFHQTPVTWSAKWKNCNVQLPQKDVLVATCTVNCTVEHAVQSTAPRAHA